MRFIQNIKSKARKYQRRLVLPEGTELRTVHAARKIAGENLAGSITLLGQTKEIKKIAICEKIDISSLHITDPERSENKEQYGEELFSLRKHKGMTRDEASKLILHPLYWSAMMIRHGEADAMVAGAENSTADVLKAALHVIQIHPGKKLASSFLIVYLPGTDWGVQGHLIFSDCAIVPDPDSEQLAEIAMASADSFIKFMDAEPIIALLSFSTKGSAVHRETKKVINAYNIVKEKRPDLKIDGELQVDSALIPEVAERKAPGSEVAGKANILIFPDLSSANIGYKLVQRLAGAEVYGPHLQGFNGAVSDLSRGCSIDDIVNVSALTLADH